MNITLPSIPTWNLICCSFRMPVLFHRSECKCNIIPINRLVNTGIPQQKYLSIMNYSCTCNVVAIYHISYTLTCNVVAVCSVGRCHPCLGPSQFCSTQGFSDTAPPPRSPRHTCRSFGSTPLSSFTCWGNWIAIYMYMNEKARYNKCERL